MTENLTPGRALYDRQVRFLVDKDVDGLVETNYAPDAELISFQNVIKGREALRAYFRGYIEMLGDIVVESTDKFAETDDAIFFEATVSSKLGRVRVYDAWTLRDGQISHHFTGVMGT
ncbi:MAG: nuclear transport factor 2 family protein [Actinomycetes bacterium]